MGDTEFRALVGRAQEIDKACKKNSADMESLKKDFAEFKKNAGGGSTKKKEKGFWESLLGGSDNTEEEGGE